jgi:hypothetical protein
VVRRRLQRSLLVARLWPDLTLLFAGRGGDVRCKYGQTGPWRTMPHQTTRSGIPSGASRPYAVVRSRRAMHGRHVHLPTLRWPRSDETALLSALDRHFRDTVAVSAADFGGIHGSAGLLPLVCSDRAHLGVARRVVASIRGGSGRVGLDVGEHAAAIPGREGPYEP